MRSLVFSLLVFSLFPISLYARSVLLVLQDDLKDSPPEENPNDPTHNDPPEWDEFGDSEPHKSDEELDPGSWRPIFEPDSSSVEPASESDALYYSGVMKMVRAVSSGEELVMEEGAAEIDTAAASGHPHARSVLAFLHSSGQVREKNKGKAFMYHHFAAEGGNMQSKMSLAYTYFKQDVRTPISAPNLFLWILKFAVLFYDF